MGTLVFARILSEAHLLGYPSNFTIYDSQDSLRAILELSKKCNWTEMFTNPNKF
jgi:DNA helicase-2/ATP-dependent DNA helicase PcrA